MNYKSIYKIPNGKLLKINLNLNDTNEKIDDIKITGDFFAYPEESIELIENKLKNCRIEKNLLMEKIIQTIKKNNIEFIGLDAEGLVDGIMMCLK